MPSAVAAAVADAIVCVVVMCCFLCGCCMLGVVVEWFIVPQEELLLDGANISKKSLIFVGKMCAFVSRPRQEG